MADSTKEAQFALQALTKIPSQFASIQRLGILGAQPNHSIPQFHSEIFDQITGYSSSQVKSL